ncbi:delta-12 fatty acid desaturas-like protein [Aspergillus ibericus CBS 121593]|uniref:Delta-12 fatty acid desaturas-like protein n=1 Tax=Aspergillus ibericus CBS 121593 TaxID=1448316 RepID=A0A395GKX8_9EURO|nr:delta-12 fatty acid desaturas-like protein [Aspergillus ibericus CBS 121593]RAK95936.1 delta-12 fatty acid desaturas-like protein [Aspergillus ibericus CBS 121593]
MELEPNKTGFQTLAEPHPTQLVPGGRVGKAVTVDDLRRAVPDYCFTPSLFWSFFYLVRDLAYSGILLMGLYRMLNTIVVQESPVLYYLTVIGSGFDQGFVWTGLWVIAHACGHSSFSRSAVLNDSIGFSTHRRHHIYANHIDKDLNSVPPQRQSYAEKIGQAAEVLEEIGQDAPWVLFLRIVLQPTIGWNWYILTNITCPPTAVVKPGMSMWRHDLGCLATIAGLYHLYTWFGSFETLFWVYIMPWTWVNHWIVMITYLHHTHPAVPQYTSESWTFLRGATATIDHHFGLIGTHFFHRISSDHVTHHLFSRISHYYARTASQVIIPLLGRHYHGRGDFNYQALETAFARCQWVEEDGDKDVAFGLRRGDAVSETDEKHRGLWYRSGRSPMPECKMLGSGLRSGLDRTKKERGGSQQL